MDIKKLVNRIKKENFTVEEYKAIRKEIDNDFVYYSLFEHVFEKSHDIDYYKRENSGAIYTPEHIVELMVDSSFVKMEEDLWNCKVLEPSAGSGNFVQVVFEKLVMGIKNQHPEKSVHEIMERIATHILYVSELNIYALLTTVYRIKDLYNVTLKNVFWGNSLLWSPTNLIDNKNEDMYLHLKKIEVDFAEEELGLMLLTPEKFYSERQFESTDFDLIIGNPPYGNLLPAYFKKLIADKHSNVALNFFDIFIDRLKEKGVLSFIAPHSFTRANGNKKWRQSVFNDQYLFELIDCGNPFYDITLETVIYNLKKDTQATVKLSSLKDKGYTYEVNFEKLFKEDTFRFILYYDDEYERIQKLPNLIYPFGGKRGKDVNKKELQKEPSENSLWVILGKNISKNGLVNVNNYDCYIDKDRAIDKNILKNDVLAITQFGTNLKAAVLDKECYPSGGVVVVSHDGLSIDKAKDYLNESYINYYLKRYVLNNADLTVHLDGVYLKEIPYNILNK